MDAGTAIILTMTIIHGGGILGVVLFARGCRSSRRIWREQSAVSVLYALMVAAGLALMGFWGYICSQPFWVM